MRTFPFAGVGDPVLPVAADGEGTVYDEGLGLWVPADVVLAAEMATALAAKANTAHGHAQGDITGLAASLAAKADDSDLIKPYVEKSRVAAQTLTTAIDTYITWDTEGADPFGLSSVPVTSIAVADRAGIWATTAYVTFAGSSIGIRRIFGWKNSTMLQPGPMGDPDDGSAFHCAVSFASYLAIGDYHRVSAYHNVGSNLNVNSGRAFSYFVGPVA